MAFELRETDASKTWRSILLTFTATNSKLADEMETETGLALERYEILLLLTQTEDTAMRPSELAERLRLSRSGATRLVDRLEKDGLVERRACEADARGSFVALTPAGWQAFKEAGRVHLRGIKRHVGSRLNADEMHQLRKLLEKISEDPAEGPKKHSCSDLT